jgi:hypothetical protein
MSLNVYKLQGFRGGIADDAYKGVAGSFRFGYNLDIRSGGDTLKCNQALKKDSESVVTDLILFFIPASNGKLYGFGDTGRIYRKDSLLSSWSLAYADPDGKITGAQEYTNNDGSETYRAYLYWATESKLKRIKLTGDWAADVEQFGNLNGDSSWHTMLIAVGVLQICDGRYIAMVDYEGNFNNQALDLIAGNRTKTLLPEDQTVIIGSTKGDKVEEGWLWTWDKVQPSWILRRMIAEKGVNATIHTDFILIQAGINGGLYFWDTVSMLRIKQLPGGGWVNPGAISNCKGMALLGVTGSDKCGVYSYGRLNKNDSYALNLEYVPSHGKLSGAEIGAVTMYGDQPFVSWRDGSSCGVDTIDSSNKADARYEGLVFDANEPFAQKEFRHIKLLTKPLPAQCWIKVYYRLNEEGDWKPACMEDDADCFDKEGMTKAVFTIETGGEDGEEKGKGETYELALELYPSGNATPEIVAVCSYFESMGIF